MDESNRIVDVVIENENERAVAADIIQERNVAIYDLCSGNSFTLNPRKGKLPPPGPYKLRLSLKPRHVVFDVRTEDDNETMAFHLALEHIRRQLSSYCRICQEYNDAICTMPRDSIDQVDRIRRTIHDEGAQRLQERLSAWITVDMQTARLLFTLIHAAHPTR